MKVEDYKKFEELMTALSELFDKSPGEQALKMYAMALQPFTIEQVTRAVERAITELKFFPKPAELIEMIQGSVADRAELAWQVAWEAYKRAGYYESVVFQDGAIARTILIIYGGWVQFSEASRTLSPEMFQARRKEFLSTYKRESQRPKEPQRLPGHFEIENLNTVSTWTRGTFGATYKQSIYIAKLSGGCFVTGTYQRSNAQLIESTLQLLEASNLPELPEKPRMELLPAPPPEPSAEARALKPEEIKEQIRNLTKAMTKR